MLAVLECSCIDDHLHVRLSFHKIFKPLSGWDYNKVLWDEILIKIVIKVEIIIKF